MDRRGLRDRGRHGAHPGGSQRRVGEVPRLRLLQQEHLPARGRRAVPRRTGDVRANPCAGGGRSTCWPS
jgi:hypothetical protein